MRGYLGCIGGTWFEVAVEHGLAPYVVLVGHSLGHAVLILQGGAVDGSDQRLTEVELIDLKHTITLPRRPLEHTAPLPRRPPDVNLSDWSTQTLTLK